MANKKHPYPGNEIKIWLMRRGIKQSDINRALGYKLSGGCVCHFLRGVRYPKRVVDHLEKLGCPPHLLSAQKKHYDAYRKSLKKGKR